MKDPILLLLLLIPFFAGLLVLVIPRGWRFAKEVLTSLSTLLVFLLSVILFRSPIVYSLPWVGFGWEFSLRLYPFSGFILLSVAFFGFLIALYSAVFMQSKKFLNQFYFYFLITLAFVNGAVLADNLLLLLFFWEGTLLALFGMIAIGREGAYKSATKAFIIVGITDLCMMIGIGLTGHLARTLTLSEIHLPLTSLGSLAFVLLMIGAISKAGSMPFHSWIPDAAMDAPLPFMAFLPASLEKLLGIYFLARISLDLFELNAHSWVSTMLMVVGGITIVAAVMMALVQKDYKRLLSYHAISQVGYMILGIGTCLPIGIIGGLFHMLNNALYKSCLFLTGGAVEKQAGTTNLEKLGGLAPQMPVTFVCFFITALSISGVPPFNGFFSKELVYDAAFERGAVFYLAALLGSFFTAASFLKLGHAAYLGKSGENNKNVKEAPLAMLLPMIVIALACIVFGLRNDLPIKNLIQPVLGPQLSEGRHFYGMPANTMLVVFSVLVLAGALINHMVGVRRTGSGLKAADHIHYAPVLSGIYEKAEKKYFDPYEIGLKIAGGAAKIFWAVDRGIDWIYDRACVGVAETLSVGIRRLHTGNYSFYIAWAVLGMSIAVYFVAK
jgi:formate hydrogenlyase subunit 3/multisubunit Na+/H+ antiporter MnhD subunit